MLEGQAARAARLGVDVPAAGTVTLTVRPDPEERVIDVYFDFTCPYSRRTARWWAALDEPARWRPFLLRESHRDHDGPAEWDRADAFAHVSVLALALHEAVDAAGGDTAAYRFRAVDAFDAGRIDAKALRALAADAAGDDFDDRALRDGLARVAASHRDAVALGVFGTPTLVDGGASAYLKLAEHPAPDRARPVLDAVLTVLRATPEVQEIKRPG